MHVWTMMAKVFATVLCCCFLWGSGLAQSFDTSALGQSTKPVRIEVRHGDPYLIVSMLQGISLPWPEISTAMLFVGVPPPTFGTQGPSLFPDGTFIVNPTDNSIWYIPNRR